MHPFSPLLWWSNHRATAAASRIRAATVMERRLLETYHTGDVLETRADPLCRIRWSQDDARFFRPRPPRRKPNQDLPLRRFGPGGFLRPESRNHARGEAGPG